VTADLWAWERRAYLDRLAVEAEVELLALQLQELERRVGHRDAGRRYALMLGLPESLANVAAVAILSPSRAARLRAGDLIGRALLRAARKAVA
jgi:hypothetical protein